MGVTMAQILTRHSLKDEFKLSLRMCFPLVASSLIYSLSGFISTMMVARLGEDALAASALGSMIWVSVVVFAAGLLNAVSVLIAQQHGSKNFKAIPPIMGQAYLWGIIVSLLMIMMLLLMPILLEGKVESPSVLGLLKAYLRPYVWVVPQLILVIILDQFLLGIGRTKLVLWISFGHIPLEVLIIYCLVFGKAGCPELGISGIGYGFAISYFLSIVLLGAYLGIAKFYKPFAIYSAFGQFYNIYFKELFRIGWPISFSWLIEVSVFAAIGFMMTKFDSSILAAHQVGLQFFWFFINLGFGVAQTVAVRVGFFVGEQNKASLNTAALVGMILGSLAMLLPSLAYWICPELLISLDLDPALEANTVVIHESIKLLVIIGFFQVIEGFRLVLGGILRGIKDTRIPMLISVFSFWVVGIVASYILGVKLNYQAVGIWIGLSIGVASGVIALYLRWQKLIQVVDLKKILEIKT